MRPRTQEKFIALASALHNNKYTYDTNVVYVNDRIKQPIICPVDDHGTFVKSPLKHLCAKQGCPKCAKIACVKKLARTTESFVQNAIQIHGNLYGYDYVVYKNDKTKVSIFCFVCD